MFMTYYIIKRKESQAFLQQIQKSNPSTKIRVKLYCVKGVSAGRVLVLIQVASLASPQNSLRSFRGVPPALADKHTTCEKMQEKKSTKGSGEKSMRKSKSLSTVGTEATKDKLFMLCIFF